MEGIENNKKGKNIEIIKKYKVVYFIILGVILVISISLIVVALTIKSKNSEAKKDVNIENEIPQQSNVENEQKTLVQRKIDGVMVNIGNDNLLPYAIMIENSIDARPISGINEANILYEIQTEGTITRFLAIYAGGEKIDKIGPVRSARSYYAQIADEYNPLFIHFGGSPDVLNKISKGFYNFYDLNGIIYDQIYLYRDSNRKAPHNAYISTDLIQQYLKKQNISGYGSYTPWKFNSNIQVYNNQKDIDKVDVIYNKDSDLYNVTWKYNSDNKNYTRYLYGKDEKYFDDNGNEVTTNNIIIQFATSQIIDEAGRRNINLTEGGKAIMIRDGKYIEGYWIKDNILDRTKFFAYDENNNAIEYEFKPGKIWIHIIPKENYDLIKK
ncbi:MAG TPA: DUF3048 domain-containing protein [bacterium]|nr:DUF3048 domain-containing protein [bacterium]